MFKLMAYIISTEIEGTTYCIKTNVKKNCFELIPLITQSDLNKAFTPPHNTQARFILNWINENDPSLAGKELKVQPEARYRR
jgi:hypothetical protein|tara:strand:+ start:74 stop:319 length:246 start_codon:yes stop_codon:yes gene_type:complete